LLTIRPSSQFKKDIKRIRHNKRATQEIDEIVQMLAQETPLPAQNRDHELVGGEYKSYRECHVRPDLLLVYRINQSILELYLLRVGTHNELDL